MGSKAPTFVQNIFIGNGEVMSEDWYFTRVEKKLDQILALLKAIQRKEEHMAGELDDLELAVAENTSKDDSIIQLVNGLAAQIESMKTDPVRLQALATALRTSTQRIVDAINANTPPVPVP